MNSIPANIADNFNHIHTIAREIVALREIVELKPHPEIQEKIHALQSLAAMAQRAAMSIQGDCQTLVRRVVELENKLARTSEKDGISQQYPISLERLEGCEPLSAQDYLLIFRDRAGSKVTFQLCSTAIPELLKKLESCR